MAMGLPALLLAACTGCGTVAAGDGALRAEIDALAVKALAAGPIAGMSVAILRGDVLVVNQGYGAADRERGVPATAGTVYDIASVSKLLTAAAVLQLVDAGRLRLDDDIASLLAAFPNADHGRRITVQQLLSHTSGLADYEQADTERVLTEGKALTTAFVLEFLRDRPLEFEPGSRWSYSNTGFYLLALVVEQVSSRSFANYVREEVALPLGLADTFSCDDDRLPGRRSRGYQPGDGGLVPSPLYALPNLLGDGGLALLYQGNGAWGRADYPMDRLVFHTAGGRTVGLSEYYNGVFATYRHALDESTQGAPGMTRRATGTFEVTMTPAAETAAELGRMSLDKRFEGDLQGVGRGEMLTAMTGTEGSAGYVAMERVTGTLHGREGSFVLQHTGTMNRGAQQLSITVVPDSGTGKLAGIAGTFAIRIEDGRHYYDFEYSLPE